METAFDQLNIGPHLVTKLNDAAYECVLPSRKHSALYEKLDGPMSEDAACVHDHDTSMKEVGSKLRDGKGKISGSGKRAEKRNRKINVALKTGPIRASRRSNNNMVKRSKRCHLREKKEERTERIQGKRRRKKDMKCLKSSLSSMKVCGRANK